jgi:hypothetical protein
LVEGFVVDFLDDGDQVVEADGVSDVGLLRHASTVG